MPYWTTANKNNCQTLAVQDPVDNQPENPIGVVHGKLTPVVFGIISATVAKYERIKFKSGHNMNGIMIIGFQNNWKTEDNWFVDSEESRNN